MNVFIWKRRDNATDHYHPEGGAVAVAESVQRARALLKKETPYVHKDSDLLSTEPDIIYPVPDTAVEYAEVFPDAGCC